MPLLVVEGLDVRFAHPREPKRAAVRAVRGIDFTLERGETLGVVGESGSGKSVACLALMRLLPAALASVSAKRMEFDGIDLLKCDRRQINEVRGKRVAMVFQDPSNSLNPYMRVGRQLAEALRARGDRKALRQRIAHMLGEVGIPSPEASLNRYAHEFSGGQQQRIMLAMALLAKPDLLIADEPTTALDVLAQAQILDLISRQQKKYAFGMLFVSHDLLVVAQVAQRTMVMGEGKILERGATRDLFGQPEHPHTARLIASLTATREPARSPSSPNPKISSKTSPQANPEKPILVARGIRCVYRSKGATVDALRGVDFELRRGEIVGLVGASGSGKTTLARALLRLIPLQGGELTFNGRDLSALPERRLRPLRKGLQMIFQNPFGSLNPRMTVREILAETLLHHRVVPPERVTERSLQWLAEVGLDGDALGKYAHQFSGGQCQRVAIARACAAEPILTVADEPVSALDATIQAQILDLLLKLVEKHGLAMLFVSHDLNVARYLCDRIAVMHEGLIVECDATAKVFSKPRSTITRQLLEALPKAPTAA